MPLGQIEEAAARMLELFPDGYAEEPRAEDAVELVAYTTQAGVGRLCESFGAVAAVPVSPGWEEAWKRFHRPTVVGSLWVGPPWTEPNTDQTPVVIDPGQAFGTGGHPTTRLCLELLQELERGSVLDLGCGSGVLAIAAAKLGFGPVLAFDRDEAAVEATRRNASRNGVALEIRRRDALDGALPAVDLALANIDLPTLNALLPRADCRLAVTSGYGARERPRPAGFWHRERRTEAEWAADLFERE